MGISADRLGDQRRSPVCGPAEERWQEPARGKEGGGRPKGPEDEPGDGKRTASPLTRRPASCHRAQCSLNWSTPCTWDRHRLRLKLRAPHEGDGPRRRWQHGVFHGHRHGDGKNDLRHATQRKAGQAGMTIIRAHLALQPRRTNSRHRESLALLQPQRRSRLAERRPPNASHLGLNDGIRRCPRHGSP